MNEKFFNISSEKQDRIINATLKVFAQNSFNHASTDTIVNLAGISKGLLFHYFQDKMSLYAFVTDFSVKYLLMEYDRVLGQEDLFSFYEKVEQVKKEIGITYPYLVAFMNRCMEEREEAKEDYRVRQAIEEYNERFMEFRGKVIIPELKEGVVLELLEGMIKIITSDITRKYAINDKHNMENASYEIKEYLDLLKKTMLK